MAHPWEDQWPPYGVVPIAKRRLPASAHANYVRLLTTPRGLAEKRGFSHAVKPAQSGDQVVFGSSKWARVFCEDGVNALPEIHAENSLGLMPMHVLNDVGQPMAPNAVPNLFTWADQPHEQSYVANHPPVCGPWFSVGSNGQEGRKESHATSVEHVIAILTGDLHLREQLRRMAWQNVSMNRKAPNDWVGGARAGRWFRMLALAYLCPGTEDIRDEIADMLRAYTEKYLAVWSGKDAPSDQRYRFVSKFNNYVIGGTADGAYAPWQESEWVAGLEATLVIMGDRFGRSLRIRLRNTIRIVAESCVRATYALPIQAGDPTSTITPRYTAPYVLKSRLDRELVFPDDHGVEATLYNHQSGIGYWWTLPAVRVALDLSDDTWVQERAQAFLDKAPPAGEQEIEWAAITARPIES